uniref:Small ribosomal subunit protein uS11c n=1 Tax=Phacus pleuronectes TaxID=102908 RepID=A0A3G3LLU3_9EUGL|nr:ribosomal protein S11 [Phacus pleuronectes]AYQ93685.1 ribosomal protein S11 [Phacus pleuronectes]
MIKQKKISSSKLVKKKLFRAIIHFLNSSFNNTIISITDLNGNVLFWSSAGNCGFKGSRKSTPFASQIVSETVLRKVVEYGIKQLEINISGISSGRDSAIRSVQNFGLSITVIRDVTSIPHNGCRPKKKRRV